MLPERASLPRGHAIGLGASGRGSTGSLVVFICPGSLES
jgi:hypothetical protein